MRLIDLEPHWIGLAPGHACGISFLCPCCRQIRLAVAFAPEIGSHVTIGLAAVRKALESPMIQVDGIDIKHTVWSRGDGEMFENLTLAPSIDSSENDHWHGHITNGSIV